MRVAIIGAGFIAGVHAEELLHLGHEIVRVIDHNLSNAESFARKWNAQSFSTNYQDALSSDIDVVHVCTPPTLHYQTVKDALNAGKHVICEKPMCLDSGEAKELMLLADEKKCVTAINFNVRFHEACRRIKGTIDSAEFGKINLIHGSYLQEFHALPAEYMWRYIEKVAGPMRATTEIGSHWIDLARYLTGLEIVEVSANYGKFNPVRYLKDKIMYETEQEGSQRVDVNSDDAAVVSLRFSNGAIGSLLLSEVSHGRNNKISIEINGSKQSVWWDTENPYSVSKAGKLTGINVGINAFGGGFPDTFRSFFTEVYKDIKNGAQSKSPSYPTFKDGYLNSAVCNAIYESANNNSIWVKVK